MTFAELKLAVAKEVTVTGSVRVLLAGLYDMFEDGGAVAPEGHKEMADAVVANTPLAIESATVDEPTGPIQPINVTKVADNQAGLQQPMNQQPSTEAETPAPPMNPAVDEGHE